MKTNDDYGCGCGKPRQQNNAGKSQDSCENPRAAEGVTRRDAERILSSLLPRLPYPECRTCDCFQGFLTQLEVDSVEDLDTLLDPLRVKRESMHRCLGCDPCPPGEAFTEYIRRRR